MRLVDSTVRRHAATLIAAAISSAPLSHWSTAHAEYGAGANVAPPALVPSPFRPTGALAETCEVVALGREDVCLEYKLVLTAYDKMQLDKSITAMGDMSSSNTVMASLLGEASRFLTLINKNAWDELGAGAKAFDLAALEQLAGSNADLVKKSGAVKKDVAAVQSAAKSRDASPIARATIKFANDVMSFADSL